MKVGSATTSQQQPLVEWQGQPNTGPAAEQSAEPKPESSAPLINPVLTVESSGLVVLQYRDDAGEVEVQIPSKQAVRAYEQNREVSPSAVTPDVQAAAASVQAAAVQPPAPNPVNVQRQTAKVEKA